MTRRAFLGMVLALLVAAGKADAGVILSDNFNRADGPVGNGWSTWHDRDAPSDNIRIENEQLKTLGAPSRAGGIYRTLSVTLPVEFTFQFRTSAPHDGGWDIRFNGADSSPLGFASANHACQARFTHAWGSYQLYQRYLNDSDVMAFRTVSSDDDRNYPSSNFATVWGRLNADLSATIMVSFNDGVSPNTVTYAFDAVTDAATDTPGGQLVLSNINGSSGPHYFDNLQIVPEPSTIAMWSLFGLAGVAYWWRRRWA